MRMLTNWLIHHGMAAQLTAEFSTCVLVMLVPVAMYLIVVVPISLLTSDHST
jgi:hypothetical protein